MFEGKLEFFSGCYSSNHETNVTHMRHMYTKGGMGLMKKEQSEDQALIYKCIDQII